MNTPDRSGEALRAIAQSYRDEIGPARAEQLVSRAMARANARPSHSKAIRLLVPSLALAAGVLAVGLMLIVGNSDSGSQVSNPQPPVASGTAPDVVISEGPTAGVPTISKERLMEALDLIDQQKEREAAEVVVSALSAILGSAGTGGTTEDVSSPPTAVAEADGTPTTTTTVRGAVPPEQGTYPGGESSPGLQDPEIDPPKDDGEDPQQGTTVSQPAVSDPQPTIEELGQILKVEVEELLSADPEELAEAAENARIAATPILEYHDEPSIILPSDDDEDDTGGG